MNQNSLKAKNITTGYGNNIILDSVNMAIP